jgi:beta-phosphoglucomutase-like phosphatase (HAD superfamily)
MLRAILCAEDAPVKKPDPQVYAVCLRRLEISAREAIAIEDSPAGAASARSRSVPVSTRSPAGRLARDAAAASR